MHLFTFFILSWLGINAAFLALWLLLICLFRRDDESVDERWLPTVGGPVAPVISLDARRAQQLRQQ
jgi:hypothetical protein